MDRTSYSLRHIIIALLGMSRPLPLASTILVWILGLSIAIDSNAQFEWISFGFGFFIMLNVSISIHYANEYADYETDVLTKRTPYSGGSGILPSKMVSRKFAFGAACITLILGIAAQLIANFTGVLPWSAMVVLVIGAIGGWMYSLPPLKLAWHGFGELDNAILGGMMMPLYGYVILIKRFDWWVMFACLPFTLLAFDNLLAVTWPDREADAQAGKHTLATRWSVNRLRTLHQIVAFSSFLSLVLLVDWILPREVVFASFTALPFLLWGSRTYTRDEISIGTIYGMVMMLIAQILAWLL